MVETHAIGPLCDCGVALRDRTQSDPEEQDSRRRIVATPRRQDAVQDERWLGGGQMCESLAEPWMRPPPAPAPRWLIKNLRESTEEIDAVNSSKSVRRSRRTAVYPLARQPAPTHDVDERCTARSFDPDRSKAPVYRRRMPDSPSVSLSSKKSSASKTAARPNSRTEGAHSRSAAVSKVKCKELSSCGCLRGHIIRTEVTMNVHVRYR